MWSMLRKLNPFPVIPDLFPHSSADGEVKLVVSGYSQTDSYSCGAVAAFSIIRTFHPDTPYWRVTSVANPHPEWGMSTRKVATTLRAFGVSVSVRNDLTLHRIHRAINDGFPIIVCIGLPSAIDGHWVVIYGYGCKPDRIFVSGQVRAGFSREEFRWKQFVRRWRPYGAGLVCGGKPIRRLRK